MNTEGSVTNSPLECHSFPVNPPNMSPLSDLTTVKGLKKIPILHFLNETQKLFSYLPI